MNFLSEFEFYLTISYYYVQYNKIIKYQQGKTMQEDLLKNIDSVPSLPESVQEVERLYRDIDSTFEDMQVAIDKDPFLTANILRLVNSPLYGMRTKVTSVQKAISLLGKGAIRTFVLSSAIDSNFEIDLSAYKITNEQFRLACERQMALGMHWHRQAKSASLLATTAFLVDIGRLIISKTLIEEDKSDFIAEALASGLSISEAEMKACGSSSTEVTATLFTHWELDSNIISLIRYSENPQETVQEEKEMAAELKAIRETVLLNGEITEESMSAAKETIEKFGLDLEAYEKALAKILDA